MWKPHKNDGGLWQTMSPDWMSRHSNIRVLRPTIVQPVALLFVSLRREKGCRESRTKTRYATTQRHRSEHRLLEDHVVDSRALPQPMWSTMGGTRKFILLHEALKYLCTWIKYPPTLYIRLSSLPRFSLSHHRLYYIAYYESLSSDKPRLVSNDATVVYSRW